MILGSDFEWVSNFSVAVSKGLGFRVDLSKDPLAVTQGYDQLIVIGLKYSADDGDGKSLVEEMITNHHYSRKGFSLVPQGTPTNNTDEGDAGFTKHDPLNQQGYFVEAGSPLFDPTTTKRDALTDGQRLAEWLGIGYEPLQYVGHADARDYTEASAMNSALYSGTLGYFMNSMLNKVVSPGDLKKLRYHFKRYVVGRGPLPAIRVGNQPYGVLVTSAFPDWAYNDDPFLSNLFRITKYLDVQWSQRLPQIAHISKTGNAGANLMEVLGLHPTSVEFFQRIGHTYDQLKNMKAFASGGGYTDNWLQRLIENMLATQMLRQFGYSSTNNDGTPRPVPFFLQLIFQHKAHQLTKNNLIDGLPFSDKHVKYYDEAREKHYIHWLIENAGNHDKLENKDFGGADTPTSYLFMLLLNSLLLETGNSIEKFLGDYKIDASEMVRTKQFMNISSAPSVSPWEIFKAPVNRVIGVDTIGGSFYNHMHAQQVITDANSHFAGDLLDTKEALEVLKDMSTASLERALVEHLDTLSYRLDAWQTSLFSRRLEEQRNVVTEADNRRTGIYIGSYGYIENVVPQHKRKIINEAILPQRLQEGKDNLYEEIGNGGYIHTPSLNHATAAALLRNAYLTHATAEDSDMLSVNLSSERVRRALYLVDGIRNGQSLEVLLGYLFERGLHDWTTKSESPVFLNDLIPIFREKYPVKKTKVPQTGDEGPQETILDYHVVNGLDLVNTTSQSPFIPGTYSVDQINAITKEQDNIKNSLDALRDVLTAEAAYQLALGNFDRAAAVVRCIADGTLPPDIEVINTTRGTNISITNKCTILFDTSINTAPLAWQPIAMTLRATTEPALNHWVGTTLGDPSKIRCSVRAVDKEGNTLQVGGVAIESVITLRDLDIQAIDVMYLTNNKTESSGASELESRIRYVFVHQKALADDVIVRIAFLDNGEDPTTGDETIRSIGEILPMVNAIRILVSGSRPAHAKDFEPASKVLVAESANPNNVDASDLQTRVENIYDVLEPLFQTASNALDQMRLNTTTVTVNALRSAMKFIADAGFSLAFPNSAFGDSANAVAELDTQAESLLGRFNALKSDYADELAVINDTATALARKVSLLTELVKTLLGSDFIIIPQFNFVNENDVAQSYATRAQLLQYAGNSRGLTDNQMVVDEWLHGVSQVRSKMHTFDIMRTLHDGFHNSSMACDAIQLPHLTDDTWLAVEFPQETVIDHDTLSFLLHVPQGFDASRMQSGLLIDSWVETIPQREETTGLTFNYNQPNSVPPQAILLAVTPVMQRNWHWNHLVAIIRDTFRRAKLRAVEPDNLDGHVAMLNKFLPALISEFSTSKNNISLDLGFMVASMSEKLHAFYTPTQQ
jgi:hypothetical protein